MNYLSEKEAKFDSIYRAYADDVFKVCLYFAKDYDIAQDLAQQTFINFYDHFENVKIENTHAYLIRIARNLFYNYQRDKKRGLQFVSLSEDINQAKLATESVESIYFREKRQLMESELSDKILEFLKKEHENWYELFDKMYFRNKSCVEISTELGITEEVLYSRLYRARKCVRKRYEKKFRDISEMV